MFRFSIRELLLSTFLVAICAGWLVDRRCQHNEAQELWNNVAKANREVRHLSSSQETLRAEVDRLEAKNAKLRRWMLDRDSQREVALRNLMTQP